MAHKIPAISQKLQIPLEPFHREGRPHLPQPGQEPEQEEPQQPPFLRRLTQDLTARARAAATAVRRRMSSQFICCLSIKERIASSLRSSQ